MNKFKRKKPVFILFIIAVVFALPAIVMLLWNAILPDVIGVSEINYWQAMGIFILSKILFGGFGPGRGPRGGRHRKRAAMKERFMQMDEEEKSAFKEEWKKRCNKD